MSSETSIAGALATAAPARERRLASAARDAASPKQWDNAWRREMERVQAGAWFAGALPDHAGLFSARPDAPPAGVAPRNVSPSRAPQQAHAQSAPAPLAAPRRAQRSDDQSEREAGAAARFEHASALNGAPALARSLQVDAPADDGAPPVREQSSADPAHAMAAQAPAFSAAVPAADEAGPVQARQAAVAADAGLHDPSVLCPAQPVAFAVAAAPSTLSATQAPGGSVAVAATSVPPSASQISAATPKASVLAAADNPLTQAPRTPAAMPSLSAATSARASPPTAGNAMPMAQEGAGTAGAASGARTLASIERVLAATLGGTPGPRLHLSWDGQAVTVWLGVDGAVDPAALLRTVQNALRQQGLQLSSLVCNGRTIVQARPGQGQGQEPNSEHQEN
jgi:hypothetical protein